MKDIREEYKVMYYSTRSSRLSVRNDRGCHVLDYAKAQALALASTYIFYKKHNAFNHLNQWRPCDSDQLLIVCQQDMNMIASPTQHRLLMLNMCLDNVQRGKTPTPGLERIK